MVMNMEQRVRIAVSCRDCDGIPKVPGAGEVRTLADGSRVQAMHNGILVQADGYYDKLMTEIIKGLQGHHEPQEEKVFHEMLPYVPAGSTMVELGAYWSYYSLWFRKSVINARSFMMEPDLEHLAVGKRNFALNSEDGIFFHAAVGVRSVGDVSPRVVSVDDFFRESAISEAAVLHADIQGREFEMLEGARESIARRAIRFIFISTHGHKVHAACLYRLKHSGCRIIAEHTPDESYSVDGLIAGAWNCEKPGMVAISRRRQWPGAVKSLVTRILSRMPGGWMR